MSPARFLYSLYRRGLRRWAFAWAFLALTWMAGAALLALSGWFIASSALAGLGLLTGLNIFTPSTAIRALALAKPVTRYVERVVGHQAVLQLLAELRVGLFATVAATPAARWADAAGGERHADLVTRLTRDIDTLDAVPLRVVGPLVAAATTLAVAVGAMAQWGTSMLAVGLAAGGIALVATASFIAAIGRRRGQDLVAARAALRVAHHEHFDGLAERLAYRKADASRRRLDALARDALARERRQEQLALLGEQAVQALIGLWLVAVVALGWGALDGASLALVALMTLGLGEALGGLPGAWWRLGETEASARRLMALESRAATAGVTATPEPTVDVAAHGELVIKGLCARRQADADGAWSATVVPGRPLILHGASGSGKSSLLDTIAGELAPVAGRVEFRGSDWLALPDAARYARMAYLGQQDHLLDLTVREFLDLGTTPSEDATLHRVLDAVGLDVVFRRTGDGLDYRLGPRGSRVSGGQARRLQLAALLLRDPGIVLLDEPFRGLGAALIAKLLAVLEPWLATRCCIVVTHAPEALPAAWPRQRWPAAGAASSG